jgi:hypothetical protein
MGRLALLGFSVDAALVLLYGCLSGVFVALADGCSEVGEGRLLSPGTLERRGRGGVDGRHGDEHTIDL